MRSWKATPTGDAAGSGCHLTRFLYVNASLLVKVETAVGTTVKAGLRIKSVTQRIAPAVTSAKISKFSATSSLKPGALASV